ncbi:MAG: hypothetical protein HQL53_05315 [Magnetococcales bacterium]|nr:hypothetical protein [Magnetococcales bacterium]
MNRKKFCPKHAKMTHEIRSFLLSMIIKSDCIVEKNVAFGVYHRLENEKHIQCQRQEEPCRDCPMKELTPDSATQRVRQQVNRLMLPVQKLQVKYG